MKDENKLVTQRREPVSGEQPELSGHCPATEPPIAATNASSSSRLAISNKPRVEAETLAVHAAVAAGDVSSVEDYIARNTDKILHFRRPGATATTALVPPTSGIAALLVDPAAPKSDADSGSVSPLEVVDLRGRTPLHTACVGGHIQVVMVLLAAGADANAFDNAGFSPLHRCAQSSDLHSARALLDRNGSGGRGGASPAAGDASVVVCANSDVDVPTRRGDYRAIHLACYAGSADMVSLLARRGADVSAGDKWGASPLHRACLEGHLDAARAVLDAGAEVDSTDTWKSTPLHRACHSGHADIVDLLLRRGAATSAKDDIMQRPGQSFDSDVTSERRQLIANLLKESEKARNTSRGSGTVGNTPWPGAGAWSRARNNADPNQGKERSPGRYVPPAARAAAAAAAAAEAAAAAAGVADSDGGRDRDTPELKGSTSTVQPWRRKTSTWTELSEDRGPDMDYDRVVHSDGTSAAAAVGRGGEEDYGKFGDGSAQGEGGAGHKEEEDDEDFDNEIFELEVVGVRDGAGSETGLSDCHPTTDWRLCSFDGTPKTAFPSYHN